MTPNTDWTGIPHTCSTAEPRHKAVSNAKVVTLSKAFIRGSEVSGTFVLADGAVVRTYAGRQRIIFIYCPLLPMAIPQENQVG